MSTRRILMLEHDDDDRYITQSFFDENNYDIKIDFVSDSDALISHLKKCDLKNIPALILLNHFAAPLSAPEILKYLKSNQAYSHIPVVVLSGNENTDIVRQCYALGASSFIIKPDRDDQTVTKISNFVKYWFETVALA